MSSKLYLAYCEENKSIAHDIARKLGRAKFKFVDCSSKAVKDGEGLTFSIARTGLPGLLLLSDNFLKNEACMLNMLSFIQKSSKSENMQIVVIDGQYKTGNVPTSFDRVSNVIKYMNHWQEVYLEMRKKKRNIDPALEEDFNIQLQNIKTISSEIGDFLRVVRGKIFWSYDQMRANNFELFFKKYSNTAAHIAYTKKAAGDPKVIDPVKTTPTPFKPPVKTSTVSKPVSEIKSPKTINDLNAQKPSPVFNRPTSVPPKEKVDKPAPLVLNDRFAKPKPVTKITEQKEKEVKVIDQSKPKKELSLNEKLALKNAKNIVDQIKEEEKQIDEILNETEHVVIDTSTKLETKTELKVVDSKDALESVFQDEDSSEENPFFDDEFEEEMEEVEIVEDITQDFNPMDEIEIEDITDQIDDETKVGINSSEDLPHEEPEIKISTQILAAKSLITDGAHKAGTQHFDQLLKDHPDNEDLLFEYAQLLKNELGEPEKAMELCHRLVKLNKKNELAYLLMAEISEENNDFLAAKGFYEKMVAVNPGVEGIYYKLGLITASFVPDDPKLAAKYFKKALQQNPDNSDAYYRYGALLNHKLNKPEKALKQYKQVLKIDPVHPRVNFDLALLFNKIGNQEKATEYYNKACLVNPDLKTEENDALFSFEINQPTHSPDTNTQRSQEPVVNTDQVVLITGATSGIGLATARKFAENGFNVILTGRRDERLIQLKEEFAKKYQTTVKILPFDVRNLDEVKNMINQLEEEWKNIDILINNAGLAKGYDPIHEADIEHWDTMIDTNIKGLLYMTRAVSPNMVARKSGHIINVCSSAGKSVYPNGSVYCATKHAVDALTKSMRLDLYKHNIRVGQVSPAHVEETEFAYVRFENEEKAKIYNDFQPLKASDVADSIYFIATAPPHVNIQDIYLMGKQQAENTYIDRSGR